MLRPYIICCIVITAGLISADEELQVTTKLGTIRGSIITGIDDNQIYSFQGIPYAQPPVGDLRFKPPQPAQPWSGILNATKEGAVCPQNNEFLKTITGDEDCLFINVYTPPWSKGDKKLTVMVYVHGGAFLVGSSESNFYGPEKLLGEGIILVTLNYRLGVLGFLSTHDEAAPGNFGMLDQLIAFQWVKDNIAYFGGDPNQVTIFGQSAGGGSVSLHIASPLAKGLFTKAIAQSGSSLADWCIEKNPRQAAEAVAVDVGCSIETTRVLVDCLRTVPAAKLVEAEKKLHLIGFFPIRFSPVVEKPRTGAGFLTEEPKEILKEGRFNKVKIMMGTTRDEGIFDYATVKTAFSHKPKGFVKERLGTVLSHLSTTYQSNLDEVGAAVGKRYFSDATTEDEVIKQAIQAYTDLSFSSYESAESVLYAKHGANPYVYMVTHGGSFTMAGLFGITENLGICHGDELQHLFGCSIIKAFVGSNDTESEDDIKTGKLIRRTWTNFAKYGTPTTNEDEVEWLPMTATQHQYLDINPNPSMKNGLLCKNTEFWIDVLPKLVQKDAYKKSEL